MYWYKKAAEAGNSNAQNNLAVCYDFANGVDENYPSAVYWYQKAAEAGNSDAQFNLANCYYKGEGVEQDYSKAVYWWEKAAKNESINAMRSLAISYYNGCGVERSIDITNYWLGKMATLQKGGLTISQILKEYRFIETFTKEQFEESHNNSKLIMKSTDDGMIVLECGSERVSIVDNAIPKQPLISCICHQDDESENRIWIIHEEGVGTHPIMTIF